MFVFQRVFVTELNQKLSDLPSVFRKPQNPNGTVSIKPSHTGAVTWNCRCACDFAGTDFLFSEAEQSEDFQFAFASKSPQTVDEQKTKDEFPFSFNF